LKISKFIDLKKETGYAEGQLIIYGKIKYMATFTRTEVLVKMGETGLVPLFYNPDIEVCRNIIRASYEGGVRVFEFTNRGDFAHEIFSELYKYVVKEFPDLIMGIGSVVDPGTASLYIQLGTNFVVSPVLNEDMAKICNRRKICWTPGCGTVSEISRAEELGADVIKIFPASQLGGSEFVAAVKKPMPWTNIMPSGGVEPTEENLTKWFKSGAYCVGMGSKLFTKDHVSSGDYKKITEKVKITIGLIKKIKTYMNK
jgi:2-dehydro-3-deoxyphosphogluconate aldolase/(4S)-4-hydroxy-2-oxoglutarate aldolase